MKIIVVGCTPVAQTAVDYIMTTEAQVAGIINLHYELSAGKANYTIVQGIDWEDIYFCKDINSQETIDWISAREPDIILQLGWSQIFKKNVLKLPKLFCMGTHPSPLPVGRGAAILNWKIIEGKECAWGSSLFMMKRRVDSGVIFDFEPYDVEERDDVETLYFKAQHATKKMLERVIPRFLEGDFSGAKQNKEEITKYKKRSPEDGLMSFDWNAEQIVNYVRALTRPYPGAFFNTSAGTLQVMTAEKVRGYGEHDQGTIVQIIKGKGVTVKCGSDYVLLKEVMSDNLIMWADTWAIENGFVDGDCLGAPEDK